MIIARLNSYLSLQHSNCFAVLMFGIRQTFGSIKNSLSKSKLLSRLFFLSPAAFLIFGKKRTGYCWQPAEVV